MLLQTKQTPWPCCHLTGRCCTLHQPRGSSPSTYFLCSDTKHRCLLAPAQQISERQEGVAGSLEFFLLLCFFYRACIIICIMYLCLYFAYLLYFCNHLIFRIECKDAFMKAFRFSTQSQVISTVYFYNMHVSVTPWTSVAFLSRLWLTRIPTQSGVPP